MTRMRVRAESVVLRTQQDHRGISQGDIVELGDGRLAIAKGGNESGLLVEVVKGAQAKSLDMALKRFESFTGAKPEGIATIQRRPRDAVALQVGPLLGVMYEAVRDGKREQYFHEFKQSARPHLAATPDGKGLEIVGGRFQFTERGIVDA